jgi:hypothetical protein
MSEPPQAVGGLGKTKMPKKPKREMRRSTNLSEKISFIMEKPLLYKVYTPCCMGLSSLFPAFFSFGNGSFLNPWPPALGCAILSI